MQRSADHLLALVNDVLDHARLEAGQMRLEAIEFSLRDLTVGATEMFSALAGKKHVELRLLHAEDLDDVRVGDPMRLRQILANLISNAIKFTPATGRVTLRVSEVTADAKRPLLCFEVLDSGCGIDPEARRRLFQPFGQARASTARRHGGTGLGLVICKELVELMGGAIEVESRPGQGSIFRVRVPVAVAHGDPLRPPSTQAVDMSQPPLDMQVLLVEDDEVNREVMMALLRDIGVQVRAAESGERALEQMADGATDVVLMDCQMHAMDGLETTRRWRRTETMAGTDRMPIIALTGEAHAGARKACLEAGMDDYLSKPVSARELSSTLARWAPRGR